MPRIAVFGAGAIGCWIGGRLAAGGSEVVLIGRPRVLDELADGITVSELHGETRTAKPRLATDAAAARDADLVLVTVKSGATAEAARALAGVKGTVVSLQNGVRNVAVLRERLPRVVAGMVPFNVIHPARGRYHRASAGKLWFEAVDAAAPLTEACLVADLPFVLSDDMAGVQWSKLLLNLNNAINALSGVPLAQELANRDFRRVLARAQKEAIALLDAEGIRLRRVTPLSPRWIASLLALPDGVFRLVGGRVVAIDPSARSSMWDDLEAKRPTEIDYIQGEVVALAAKLQRDAPVNRTLVRLVKEAEAGGKRDFTGAELLAATPPTA